MNRRTVLAVALRAALFLPALPALATGTRATAEAPAEYGTRGVVRGIDAAHRRVTIQHEDVPGYMPGMTMPFEVENASLLEGLVVGDRIEFVFQPRGRGRHVIVRLRRL